jgi:hypothetical protein
MLNPDSTLALARGAAERLARAQEAGLSYKAAIVDVLLDAFVDLDQHLSGGGELPEEWNSDANDEEE